jgi:hypothetical protein
VPQPRGAKYLARYTLASTSRVKHDFSTFDTSNGCTQNASEIVGGVEGTMTIFADLSYAIAITIADTAIDVHEKCPDQAGYVRPGTVTGAGLTYDGRHRHVLNMSSSRLANTSTTPPAIRVFTVSSYPTLFVSLDAVN